MLALDHIVEDERLLNGSSQEGSGCVVDRSVVDDVQSDHEEAVLQHVLERGDPGNRMAKPRRGTITGALRDEDPSRPIILGQVEAVAGHNPAVMLMGRSDQSVCRECAQALHP